MAMQSTPPTHYGYGPQYDRDRYEQPQQPVTMPQPQAPVLPPQHSQPSNDQTIYPQHRYGTQQQPMPRPYTAPVPAPGPGPGPGPGHTVPSNTMGPPTVTQGQPPQPSTPAATYQTPPASQDPYQNYSPTQPGMYQPANKMMPPHSYVPQGPKRHPDFLKPAETQYPPYSAPPATPPAPAQVPPPPQPQPQPQAQPPTPYSGWRNDSQYPQYSNQGLHATPPPVPPPQSREEWDHRNSRPAPDQNPTQWSGMHQRYPPPAVPPGPPASVQSTPQHPNYYYQNSTTAPPHVGVQGSSPNANQRMRMPMIRDNKQAPFPPGPQHKLPPQPMAPNAQYPPKRDIVFPPNSVESVPPLLIKRKRLGGRDVSPVEAWRIMMALKSGLLCESTWALDVLSVLLYDDATVIYFNLQHLPGLLDVLLEHYRRCLMRMFNLDEDLDLDNLDSAPTAACAKLQVPDTRWYETGCWKREPDGEGDLCHLGAVSKVDADDKQVLLEGENFTYRTRRGKLVKVMPRAEDLFVSDENRLWDKFDGYEGRAEHFLGGGDGSSHIQTHFVNDSIGVQFVRIMQDVVRVKDDEDEDEEVEALKKEEELENAASSPAKKKELGDCPEESTTCALLKCAKTEATVVSAIEIKQEPMEVDDEAAENAFTRTCDKSHLDCSVKTEKETDEPNDKPSDACPSSHAASPCQTVKEEAPNGNCTEKELDLISDLPEQMTCRSPKKRRKPEDYEDEAYNRDEASLYLVTDAQDSLARRCLCISNILRGLSFVPGNDAELSKSSGFLLLLGKLLLLHHNHALRRPPHRNYDKEDESDVLSSCSSLHGEKEWWWEALHNLRENTLVTLANIAGQLDLSLYPEEVSLPILDGLLHWGVCPSAYAHDPMPTLPPQSILSPHRLSLEALCKLSVQESNVDLLLATPPFSRIERLFSYLARSLGRQEEQVVREFSVVLLHYLSQAESSVARAIALQNPCISLLIAFIEQSEQSALNIANTHGINMLRDNPEMMGTSLDMLRRAAHTLLCLAHVPENRPLFVQHQHRLLHLVTSQILDQHVASIVSDVLFECSLPAPEAS